MDASLIICDYAQVNNNKLYIVGGAANLVLTPSAQPPHPIGAWITILITVPWQAHNQAHKIVISLVDADGQKVGLGQPLPGTQIAPGDEGSVVGQFNAGRAAAMEPGDESILPMAIPMQLQVPHLGVYRVILDIDGTEIASARFRVLYPPNIGMPMQLPPQ